MSEYAAVAPMSKTASISTNPKNTKKSLCEFKRAGMPLNTRTKIIANKKEYFTMFFIYLYLGCYKIRQGLRLLLVQHTQEAPQLQFLS